jgi:hypothetical protein
MLPVDSLSIISMASLPLINNLKMDLIDNDEFKNGLTACSGILLRFLLTKLGIMIYEFLSGDDYTANDF